MKSSGWTGAVPRHLQARLDGTKLAQGSKCLRLGHAHIGRGQESHLATALAELLNIVNDQRKPAAAQEGNGNRNSIRRAQGLPHNIQHSLVSVLIGDHIITGLMHFDSSWFARLARASRQR